MCDEMTDTFLFDGGRRKPKTYFKRLEKTLGLYNLTIHRKKYAALIKSMDGILVGSTSYCEDSGRYGVTFYKPASQDPEMVSIIETAVKKAINGPGNNI